MMRGLTIVERSPRRDRPDETAEVSVHGGQMADTRIDVAAIYAAREAAVAEAQAKRPTPIRIGP
jgi:hypothetical protein